MKKHPQDSMFAFMLVAIAVPTVLIGALSVSAASSNSHDPDSTHHELFDLESFQLLKRSIHNAAPSRRTPATVKSIETTEIKPCDPVPQDSDTSAKKVRALIFEDLNLVERETLRKQLRIGGCPQDADSAYKALCESMLKKQKKPETKTGLRNSEQ